MQNNTKQNTVRTTAKQIIDILSNQLIDSDDVKLNREERREIQSKLRKFVKKHNILNITPTLDSLDTVKSFVENNFDGDTTESKDGITVSISFLNEASNDFQMNLQPRSYQREKVASLESSNETMLLLQNNRNLQSRVNEYEALIKHYELTIALLIGRLKDTQMALSSHSLNDPSRPNGGFVGQTNKQKGE